MSGAWAAGSTYRWRRTRAAVLLANANENRGQCALDVGVMCPKHARRCRGICTGKANEVHHAKGKEHGDDPRYLVACCRACNQHVGRPQAVSPDPRPASSW